MHSEDSINARMTALEEECAKLRRENAELRAIHEEKAIQKATPVARHPAFEGVSLTNQSAPNEKIAFFRRLFRGREDVYATRWIGRDGKAGYSPAGLTDWSARDDQGRPKRTPLPLTNEAFLDHLTGKQTIGVYPLLPDETCFFLAADFDKEGWQEDAAAFLKTCASSNLPAALERSRSGKGGHVWLFFNGAVPAYLARKMAAALLTQTMEERHQVGLDSYDRFFPN